MADIELNLVATNAELPIDDLANANKVYWSKEGGQKVYDSVGTGSTIGSVIDSITDIADTPASYTGEAGKLLAVNGTEDGMEFIVAPSGSGVSTTSNVLMPGYSTEEVLTTERWIDGKPIYRILLSRTGTGEIVVPGAGEIVNFRNKLRFTNPDTGDVSYNYSNSREVYGGSDSKYFKTNSNGINTVYITIWDTRWNLCEVSFEYTKAADTVDSPVAQVAISTTSNVLMPNYSTDEVLTTERWIDGKPIYRIVKDLTFSGTDWQYAPVGNVDKVCSMENSIYQDNSVYLTSGSYDYNGDLGLSSIYYDKTHSGIAYKTYAAGWDGLSLSITMEYTKTTDTADSPVAQIALSTTSNVLMPSGAVGEEIITTERDDVTGKPIYKKTISIGALPNTTLKSVIHGITDIEDVSNYRLRMSNGTDFYTAANEGSSVRVIVSPVEIKIISTLDYSTYNGEATVYYTKTTDTASSPTAAISVGGDIGPVEYDTGKRRGGKIVWGIEVDFGALPNAATKSVPIPGYNSSFRYWLDVANSLVEDDDFTTSCIRSWPDPVYTWHIYINHPSSSIVMITGFDATSSAATIVLNYTK